MNKKSLYGGRSKNDHDYRHKVRNEVIPEIVVDLFKTGDYYEE